MISRPPSVLLVDDSQTIRSALRQQLCAINPLDIDAATSGQEAIAKANMRRYSVILIDIHMPELDGFETTKRIHQSSLNQKTPVIIISSLDVTKDLLVKIYDAGAIDFLSKPIITEALLSKVRLFADLDRQHNELEAYTNKADLASQAKSLFLANMSHEMRTPLNGVIGTTELLHKTFLNEAQSRYVNVIRSCGEALLSIINDVLDLSKIEAGHITIDKKPTPIRNLIHETLYPQILKAAEQGTDLAFEIASDVPDEIDLDSVRVRQILTNLISNAIKFTQNGTVVLKLHLYNNALLIDVIDTGIGIPENRLDYIFGNFTQADLTTTKKYGGTGLGLAICRQLSRMMGGDILVKSKVGYGSTFSVTLPIEIAGSQHQPLPGLHTGTHIILCDPSKLYRDTMDQLFTKRGLKISTFSSCEDTLNFLKSVALQNEEKIILLLDEKSGYLNADDLCVIIKADPRLKDTPIYLTAGYGTEKRLDRLTQLGYSSCILKPYDDTDVIHIISDKYSISDRTVSSSVAYVDTPDLYGFRVLLVEDDMVNRMIAEEMLRDMGVTVLLASNGIEALEILETETFDLILMDCMMPVMDGYDATRAIRNNFKHFKSLPILAMTANALEGDKEKCIAAGMTDYLTKPIRTETLKRALTKYFNQ